MKDQYGNKGGWSGLMDELKTELLLGGLITLVGIGLVVGFLGLVGFLWLIADWLSLIGAITVVWLAKKWLIG